MQGRRSIKAVATYAWAQVRRGLRIWDAQLAWAQSGLEQALPRIALDPGSPVCQTPVTEAYEYIGSSRVAAPLEVVRSEPRLADMLRCLEAYDAYNYPHAVGTTFEAHLLGTWRILMCWQQPLAVTRCGLFHSAYATDLYPIPLIRASARDTMQALLGEDAEALVFLFCTMDRGQVLRELREREEIPPDGLEVRNWMTDERLHLTPHLIAAYLTIEIANMVEQARDREMRPSVWVASASEMAWMLRGYLTPLPPVFDACSRRLSPAAEEQARRLYVTLEEAEGWTDGRRCDSLLDISKANPWIAEPYLDLASQVYAAGDIAAAGAYAKQARTLLLQWGTAWDKRRSWEQMLDTAQQLASG